ncbi:hypothetical protein ABT158_48510 [Nonomuraea sp. NPDC001636]|uniref:hypothetical protein n=1 Tax=Nonomuraea sp. NPDC001636 TaxID=3154391 RepID=UPI0033228D5D
MSDDVFPAVIVRTSGTAHANLQVHLDGNDTYWVTSRSGATSPALGTGRPAPDTSHPSET